MPVVTEAGPGPKVRVDPLHQSHVLLKVSDDHTGGKLSVTLLTGGKLSDTVLGELVSNYQQWVVSGGDTGGKLWVTRLPCEHKACAVPLVCIHMLSLLICVAMILHLSVADTCCQHLAGNSACCHHHCSSLTTLQHWQPLQLLNGNCHTPSLPSSLPVSIPPTHSPTLSLRGWVSGWVGGTAGEPALLPP